MNCFRGRLYEISFSRLLLGAGESRVTVLFTSLTFVTGKSCRYATNMTLSHTDKLDTGFADTVQTGSQRNEVMQRACILVFSINTYLHVNAEINVSDFWVPGFNF